ncbi:hypothetical protein GT039_33920, partial [Streptomyces sp. SID2955]|nr:hypothetical protein [Streptomyces sp. SID2955]
MERTDDLLGVGDGAAAAPLGPPLRRPRPWPLGAALAVAAGAAALLLAAGTRWLDA